jgi:hypothetical protein
MTVSTANEAALMDKIAAGDPAALTELYDSTAAAVFGLISRVFPDEATAEPVLLDVFSRIWREAGFQKDSGIAIQEWVRQIALSTVVTRRFEQTTDPALLNVQPVTPPGRFREMVEAHAKAQPRRSAEASEPAARPLPAAAPRLGPSAPPPGPGMLPWVVAVIGIAAAVFFWYRSSQSADSVGQLTEMLATAEGKSKEFQSTMEQERGRTRNLEQVATVIGKPGTRIAQLTAAESADKIAGALFWDSETGKLTLAGTFPAPAADMVYQLWFTGVSAKTSVASFKPDADGLVLTTLDVPAATDKPQSVGVTLEPSGGSAQPTSRFRAQGRFQ